MGTLTSLILRFVLSLAATFGIATVGATGPNIVEFLVVWFMIYVMITVYYYIRVFRRYHTRIIIGFPIIGLLLEYIIIPLIIIAVLLVAVPEGISFLFPDTWRENVQMVITITEMFGLTMYDVWKIKKNSRDNNSK